jgi:hypothetical protein
MLEFNLDGKLVNNFDNNDLFQGIAGQAHASYGLPQQNPSQPAASAELLPQDTLPSPWDEGDIAQHQDRLQANGAIGKGHNAMPTEAGVSASVLEMAESGHDQLIGKPQTNSEFDQHDQLTGNSQAREDSYFSAALSDTFTTEWISDELISHLGERTEVNNLLAEERFDRDQTSGTETFYNLPFGSGLSANEDGGYDVTDSRTNAAEIGTVAYRDDKKVIGTIGTTSGGYRDANDYFSFYAGKSGNYDLSLTNLTANVGLALYNDSGSLLSWSNKSGTQDESLSTFLNEGWYTSRIYSYNTSTANNNGISSFHLNVSRNADVFEQTIETWINDSSVKNAALNSIKYDNVFDRNDTIGILKSAGDYGSVSNTELTDLRQFHNMFSGTMRADIAGLSQKVVFSDASNAWYTGYDSIRNELGNLEAGSSTQNLNLLIGKHMLGTDRPMIHSDAAGNLMGSYTEAGGSLFVGGVSADDVDQGSMGTCYLLAGLAGTANDKPNMIRNMFTDNGDGTYSVRFFTNGQADYVTVDNMMATRSNGRYLYANDGGDNGSQDLVSGNNELWVALAEKAYAQINESGQINQDGTNSYAGISGGNSATAITHITGLSTTSEAVNLTGSNGVSKTELISYVNSNRVVTVRGFNSLATGSNSGPTNISSGVQNHAYSIVGYDSRTERFDIRNPWDTQHLSLTHRQLRQLGADIRYSLS